jgi:hypothetical protein
MNTFIDNLATLVVENCLINDLVDIFSATEIPNMADDVLDRLASESEDVQERRIKLETKLKCLRESLKICEKNQIHIPRGTYISFDFYRIEPRLL